MRALRFAAASGALALTLATAGCELYDPSGRDKQDVIEQTEAACKDLDKRLAKRVRPIELSELGIFYELVAGDIDKMLTKLDSFEPPDLPDWNEFVGGIHRQSDLLREAADAAVDRRQKKVNRAEGELRRIRQRTDAAGLKYGLEVKCVKLPT